MYTELSTGTYSVPNYIPWGNRIVYHLKRTYSIVPIKAFLVTEGKKVDIVVIFDHEHDGKKVQMKASYTINITTTGDQPDTITGPVFEPPLIEAKNTVPQHVLKQTTKSIATMTIKPVVDASTQTKPIEKVVPFKGHKIIDNIAKVTKSHSNAKENNVMSLVAKFNKMNTC